MKIDKNAIKKRLAARRKTKERAREKGGQDRMNPLIGPLTYGCREAITELGHTPAAVVAFLDRLWWMFEEFTTDPRVNAGLACAKGCAWCCNLKVEVSEPELFTLLAYIKDNFNDEQIQALRARLADQWERTKDLDQNAQVLANIPGALLDYETKTCTVYHARPLSCRGWTSYDAGRCETATWVPYYTTKINVLIHAFRGQIGQAMEKAMAAVGLVARNLHLPGALLFCLNQPEWIEVFRRWVAGQDVFPDEVKARDCSAEVLASQAMVQSFGGRIPLPVIEPPGGQ
jgi:hypothetical protein